MRFVSLIIIVAPLADATALSPNPVTAGYQLHGSTLTFSNANCKIVLTLPPTFSTTIVNDIISKNNIPAEWMQPCFDLDPAVLRRRLMPLSNPTSRDDDSITSASSISCSRDLPGPESLPTSYFSREAAGSASYPESRRQQEELNNPAEYAELVRVYGTNWIDLVVCEELNLRRFLITFTLRQFLPR